MKTNTLYDKVNDASREWNSKCVAAGEKDKTINMLSMFYFRAENEVYQILEKEDMEDDAEMEAQDVIDILKMNVSYWNKLLATDKTMSESFAYDIHDKKTKTQSYIIYLKSILATNQ